MEKPGVDERRRIQVLEEYQILDTVPEEVFDRIVAVAAEVCEVPIALFTLVHETRQWFKATYGLTIRQTPRDVSFCVHAIEKGSLVVIPDARRDERFADNDLVLSDPKIRFYAGEPVRARGGEILGTLCVVDVSPRALSDEQLHLLRELAREVEAQLELRRTVLELRAALDERAVLSSMVVHDARGLLTAVLIGLEAAAEITRDEPVASALEAANQLRRMFENFKELNETESRGLAVRIRTTDVYAWFAAFCSRCAERAKASDFALETRCDATPESLGACATDENLLERIASNLFENALRECPAGSCITLALSVRDGGGFELWVEDNGEGVPPEFAEQVFEPYFSRRRGSSRGSGLGLAFCRIAAEALGGSIELVETAGPGAAFRVRLPG